MKRQRKDRVKWPRGWFRLDSALLQRAVQKSVDYVMLHEPLDWESALRTIAKIARIPEHVLEAELNSRWAKMQKRIAESDTDALPAESGIDKNG